MLRIGDDGKGQSGIDESKKSLGAELLQLFCNQIDASLLHVKLEKGMHYEISFDKNR
jgi:two-component sensor histidine kinase